MNQMPAQPIGTLPAGTSVRIGAYKVYIERFLSEGPLVSFRHFSKSSNVVAQAGSRTSIWSDLLRLFHQNRNRLFMYSRGSLYLTRFSCNSSGKRSTSWCAAFGLQKGCISRKLAFIESCQWEQAYSQLSRSFRIGIAKQERV